MIYDIEWHRRRRRCFVTSILHRLLKLRLLHQGLIRFDACVQVSVVQLAQLCNRLRLVVSDWALCWYYTEHTRVRVIIHDG
jgi:hypothetical protein